MSEVAEKLLFQYKTDHFYSNRQLNISYMSQVAYSFLNSTKTLCLLPDPKERIGALWSGLFGQWSRPKDCNYRSQNPTLLRFQSPSSQVLVWEGLPIHLPNASGFPLAFVFFLHHLTTQTTSILEKKCWIGRKTPLLYSAPNTIYIIQITQMLT